MLLDFLKTARTDKGLSQSKLAAELGVARLAITRLEAGTGSTDLLVRAMNKLGLRLSGIGRGDDLPDQLRRSRLRRGWTTEQASTRTGLAAKTIAVVEKGGGSVASLVQYLETIAPKAKVTEPARPSWEFDASATAEKDQRFTPKWFFEHIVAAFGPACLDPCAHPLSIVEATRRIMLPECGLAASWAGTRLAYVNPPYSATVQWLDRAATAWERGEAETIVMLIPVRTDSDMFQSRVSRDADVLFLAKRFRFDTPEGLAYPAPFSLMLIVWGGSDAAIQHFRKLAPAIQMRPWGA
jgi:transcriptional regulator with XRE-family HTH domain